MAKRETLTLVDEDGRKVRVSTEGLDVGYADEFIKAMFKLYEKSGFVNDLTVVIHHGADGPTALEHICPPWAGDEEDL